MSFYFSYVKWIGNSSIGLQQKTSKAKYEKLSFKIWILDNPDACIVNLKKNIFLAIQIFDYVTL